MSSQRYRRLLTNLPSMATVVNSFQSPEVQREIYLLLIDALDEAVTDGDTATLTSRRPSSGSRKGRSEEALADLAEGDSIHSLSAERE